jgi:quinol monooxygenase YgiN
MTQRVEALLDELEATYATLPGYVLGFRYKPQSIPGELGRIALWRSHEDTDHAAGNTHVQALRSRLNTLIQGEHVEHVLEVEGTPHNLPG